MEVPLYICLVYYLEIDCLGIYLTDMYYIECPDIYARSFQRPNLQIHKALWLL